MIEHFIDYDFFNNVRPDETVRDVSSAIGLSKTLHFNLDFEGSTKPDDLKTILCTYGQPIIVGVTSRLSHKYGGHYVLVTGEQDSSTGPDFTIADPFGDPADANPSRRPYTLLSQYGPFFVWGFVEDPPGDMSGLDVSAGGDLQILVSDSQGRSTGFDATTGQAIRTIPHSAYFQDSVDDDELTGFHTSISHSVDVFQPVPGTYIVTIIGTSAGVYNLALRPFSQDGSAQPSLTASGIAGSASTSLFLVQFASTLGAASSVSRLATFQNTLADISNALRVGLIDNGGIANSLSQKIQAALGATSPARNNILNAFKNEVNAQAGKHITGLAAQVLTEDANSLLSQNP